MRLARAAVSPEGCGGHVRLTFEGPGEVALVREAGGEGDAGQRFISGDDLTSGEVHPQLADVFAQSTPIVLSEEVGVLMAVPRLPRTRRLVRPRKRQSVDHFSKRYTAGQAYEHDDTSCAK